ncbi:MAG: hypothetical protein LDL23_12175, partial [Flavobacterium sp.]|uniref:hypothetical protein n=1 Tax=Flavobacterium sp. TaxID=239 RepID=UPI0025C459FE
FRTEKLSPTAQMVLQLCGRVCRRLSFEKPVFRQAFLLAITINTEIEKPPHKGGFFVLHFMMELLADVHERSAKVS